MRASSLLPAAISSCDIFLSFRPNGWFFGINLRGQMVGNYSIGSVNHGFLLSRGKFKTIDVDFPGASGTFAQGINLDGDVVGSYFDSTGATRSYVFAWGSE